MIKRVVLVLCLFYWSILYAQEPAYLIHNDESGLPSNKVYNIAQDSKGFIWIGCDAGLFKYDGIRYISYSSNTQKSKPITGLCFSPSGRLYCLNFQSQLFYLENNTLRELTHHLKGIPNIVTDQSGRLFVNHEQGIACYNEIQKQWKNYQHFGKYTPYSLPKYTRSAKVNQNNEVCFLNTSGLGFFSRDSLTFCNYDFSPLPFPGQFISGCWNDEVWIIHVTNNFVYRYRNKKIEINKSKKLKDALVGRKVTNVKGLSDGSLWICTYKGLIQYDPDKDSVNLFYPELSFSDALIDRESNYWFATLNDGILQVPNLDYRVWNSSFHKEMTSDKLTKITGNGNFVYFATEDGYTGVLNTNSNLLKTFHSGSYADVQCLNYVPNDRCLHYYLNESLYSYKQDKVTQRFSDLIPVKWIEKVKEDYILASSFGIYIHSLRKKTDNYKITNSWTREILFDSVQNTIWAATNNGLMIFVKEQEKWLCKDTLFRNTQILSMDIDHDSRIFYILTFDGKIHSVSNGISKLLATLPSNTQGYKLKQHQQKIYIASNKGLWMYDGNKWETLNLLSGLVSNQVNDIYILDNTIWLATGKGLQKIPLSASKPIISAILYLKGIKVNGLTLTSTDYIELKHNHTLSVVPEASIYCSQGKFQYAYRIAAGSPWQFLPGNIEEISIPNLPAGKFKIEVKAIDHRGLDSATILILKGYSHPPFWKTNWFYAIILASVIAILVLIFRKRIQALKKKQASEIERLNLENELRLTQQMALRAQMNPHFIFNVLNSIKGYIYEADKKNAIAYLNNFSMLVRQVLENSTKEKVRLSEEIEMISTYISLEAMLLHDKLDHSIQIDKKISIEEIEIPGMLLQPYIENAFKHGLRHKTGNKELSVKFELIQEDLLKISITDNGIGRAASEILKQNNEKIGHQSFAGSATGKRIKLLNYTDEDKITVHIEDHLPEGTTVTITLQL